MDTFIKDNWFKLVMVIFLLMITLSVAYYFVIYLPKQNYVNQLFIKKTNCQKYAELIKNEVDKSNKVNNEGIFTNIFGQDYLEMIFYSPKEDSCLYVIHNLPTTESNKNREYFIYNFLTGSKITSFKFPEQWEDYKKFILEYSNGEIRL